MTKSLVVLTTALCCLAVVPMSNKQPEELFEVLGKSVALPLPEAKVYLPVVPLATQQTYRPSAG